MTGSFLDAMLFSVGVTLPSILLLVLGWYLRRSDQIDQRFCDQASKIVFNYSLPALLFFSIYRSDTDLLENLNLILAGVVTIMSLFLGAELVARRLVKAPRDHGVFVQGVFRANMMIIGLAFVSSAYGANGVAIAALFGGVLTLLLNVLAVITLSKATGNKKFNPLLMARQIVTNPLIIGILLSLACKWLHVPIPSLIAEAGGYVSSLALPLALICAGATLDFRKIFSASDIAMWSSVGRLIVAPIVAVIVGLVFALSSMELGVMLLMTASPAAAASYVMAKAMGANDVAAANIIGITTVAAMPTMAVSLTLLRFFGLI
ncbi:AEC family transporter [Oligella urethralis]|uniref:AEC family transporter n=1 Tax=Oligella urethralis TaxID=90245 RepID=UPI00036CE7A7|nr:AEC family transporter [Oligella urethralis]SUA68892.1 putative transporter YfdV [Oligella urethralis]